MIALLTGAIRLPWRRAILIGEVIHNGLIVKGSKGAQITSVTDYHWGS